MSVCVVCALLRLRLSRHRRRFFFLLLLVVCAHETLQTQAVHKLSTRSSVRSVYCYILVVRCSIVLAVCAPFFAHFIIESSVDVRRDRTYIIVVERVLLVYFGVHLNCE